MDRIAHPPLTVTEAKEQLRSAALHIDYLAPIRNHPLEAVGVALLVGLLWKRLAKNPGSPGLIAVAVQLWKTMNQR